MMAVRRFSCMQLSKFHLRDLWTVWLVSCELLALINKHSAETRELTVFFVPRTKPMFWNPELKFHTKQWQFRLIAMQIIISFNLVTREHVNFGVLINSLFKAFVPNVWTLKSPNAAICKHSSLLALLVIKFLFSTIKALKQSVLNDLQKYMALYVNHLDP